jgi:hypothetical protein
MDGRNGLRSPSANWRRQTPVQRIHPFSPEAPTTLPSRLRPLVVPQGWREGARFSHGRVYGIRIHPTISPRHARAATNTCKPPMMRKDTGYPQLAVPKVEPMEDP